MAWQIIKDTSQKEFKPNAESTRKLGYILSCLAKLIYTIPPEDTEKTTFFNDNMHDILTSMYAVCRSNTYDIPTVRRWYMMSAEEMSPIVWEEAKKAQRAAKSRSKSEEQTQILHRLREHSKELSAGRVDEVESEYRDMPIDGGEGEDRDPDE